MVALPRDRLTWKLLTRILMSRFRNTRESQWFRNMVELSILFVIVVMVLRAFVLEGYLISTGSMAPQLLGLHKQVKCPSCGFGFALGTTFDNSVDDDAAQTATCPNCRQTGIQLQDVPAAHGDQLLVHKGIFDFRQPGRWESVVFRNPATPGEAYVKRTAGLPGETIQLADGDLFVESQIARKDMLAVRSMRIPVYNDSFRPSEQHDWASPWQFGSSWSRSNGRIRFAEPKEPTEEGSWTRFRYWRRSGGAHFSEVAIFTPEAVQNWNECVNQMQNRPVTWLSRLAYDEDRQVLRLQGVMPPRMQQDLITWSKNDKFREAVFRLAALSHLAPVTDHYGYNSGLPATESIVHDLGLSIRLRDLNGLQLVRARLPAGHHVFELQLDLQNRSASLLRLNGPGSESGEKVRHSENLELLDSDGELFLEWSGFDRRVLACINGAQIFAEYDIPRTLKDTQDQLPDQWQSPAELAEKSAAAVERQRKLAISLTGGSAEVSDFVVYRDVHYTPGRMKNAVKAPLKIPAGHYFVLGDNSPVSADSRNWESPFVPHHLLIGKPFVVHLPSRPGKVSVGGVELPIRIPDWSRIRYIY